MAWNILAKTTIDRTTASGLPYQWKFTPRQKNTPARAEVSIEMQADYSVSFEQENWGRKLAKALGFATEFQTGETEFDKTVYISCDDMALCNRLYADSEMRRIILSFFRFGVSLITLRKGRLTLKLNHAFTSFSVGNGEPTPLGFSHMMEVPKSLNEEVADPLVTALHNLKRKLTLMPTGMEGEVSQSKINQQRATFCNILTMALLAVGVTAFFWDRVVAYKLTYYDLYFQVALPYGMAAITASLVLLYGMFHTSSLGYEVIRNFLIFGVAGMFLCSSEIAYHINVRMDKSPPELHVSRVLGMHITTRKGRHTYHVAVEDWHNPQKSYDIITNAGFYNTVRIGGTIRITTHPGTLGYEWIERYQ